jgi:hypothetical protein
MTQNPNRRREVNACRGCWLERGRGSHCLLAAALVACGSPPEQPSIVACKSRGRSDTPLVTGSVHSHDHIQENGGWDVFVQVATAEELRIELCSAADTVNTEQMSLSWSFAGPAPQEVGMLPPGSYFEGERRRNPGGIAVRSAWATKGIEGNAMRGKGHVETYDPANGRVTLHHELDSWSVQPGEYILNLDLDLSWEP